VKRLCAVMLMALVALLSGCASSLPISAVECPALPTMPSVSEPIPSQTYSTSAKKNIEAWLKRLTDLEVSGKP
jgi:hypothetical protein